jgi:hypothetical protein
MLAVCGPIDELEPPPQLTTPITATAAVANTANAGAHTFTLFLRKTFSNA